MPAIRGSKSKSKTRRRHRDVDQVHDDMRDPKHLAQYKDTKAAEDLPALGEFYCVECAKWFEQEHNLTQHQKGKPHKRRCRELKAPYTQEEANAAGGLRIDNGRTEKTVVDDESMASKAVVNNAQNTAMQEDDDDNEEMNAFLSAY